MRVIHDLAQFHSVSRSYVTIGVFDGVHRGHQRLITGMVEAAHSMGSSAVALAFDPHPAITLGYEPPLLLTTIEERAGLLATLGLDTLVVMPFSPATAHTPAIDFVEALVRHLRLAELWGGPDFSIGHGREGDIPFLRRLGAERGFGVRVVEPLVWRGSLVSSSRVRILLQAGDIHQATECLGRPYRLTGMVVHGDGRGRSIGVPTANLRSANGRLIPARGIYACWAFNERVGTYRAAVNIGTRPTFPGASGGQVAIVEAHLLEVEADLYGQELTLDFCARLRDEMTFPDAGALVAQMREDIAQVRAVLEGASALEVGLPGVRAATRA